MSLLRVLNNPDSGLGSHRWVSIFCIQTEALTQYKATKHTLSGSVGQARGTAGRGEAPESAAKEVLPACPSHATTA